MKIGTAFPTEEELEAVKHHFVGNLSIHDYYNAYKFEQDALVKLNKLFQTKDLVIMTGGSGLYIDAVCNGIDDMPDPEPELRHMLNQLYEKEGIVSLQEKLKELDLDYYKQIDLSNHKRLMRAIEVCLTTGKKFSDLRTNSTISRDFSIVKIMLNRPREELYERINLRVDQMVANGLIEEARQLYPYKSLNALNTVGYKELFMHFDGTWSLELAIEKIKTHSRRYAKRQLTWFRRDCNWQWFHPDDFPEIIRFIKEKTTN